MTPVMRGVLLALALAALALVSAVVTAHAVAWAVTPN